MKILFFCKFPPPFTGQTIGTKVIYKMFNQKNVEKINTSQGKISPNNFGIKYCKYIVTFSCRMVESMFALRERVSDRGIDTLYIVASPSGLGLLRNMAALLVARPHVDKIVAHVRNGNYHEIFEDSLLQGLAVSLMKRVDKFIFLSEELDDRAAPYIPSPQRAVVRNSIDQAVRCSHDEVVSKTDERANRESFRVLFLSNMIRSKGCMDLVRALLRLRDCTDRISLKADFIGDWPNEKLHEEFAQFVDAHGLGKNIRVHGRVTDRETIRQAYLNADVFVLPTYYPNEAQPRSIIEAMNAGTPIVATPHASIPEYVIDDHNGYLVSKKAPSDIAGAIRQLTDRSDWKEKAYAARETYEEMFSPSAVRESLLSLFEDTAQC